MCIFRSLFRLQGRCLSVLFIAIQCAHLRAIAKTFYTVEQISVDCLLFDIYLFASFSRAGARACMYVRACVWWCLACFTLGASCASPLLKSMGAAFVVCEAALIELRRNAAHNASGETSVSCVCMPCNYFVDSGAKQYAINTLGWFHTWCAVTRAHSRASGVNKSNCENTHNIRFLIFHVDKTTTTSLSTALGFLRALLSTRGHGGRHCLVVHFSH